MSPRTKRSATAGPEPACRARVESVERTAGPTLLATRYSLPATFSAPGLPVLRSLDEGGSKRSAPAVSRSNRSNGPGLSKRSASKAFTIVEVMMASVILVVGLIGMIQGVTIGSEMMATARRQTIAAQILEHEIGKLRLADWATVSALTDSSAATYDSDQAAIDTAIAASGVTFNLARTVSTVTTDLREVTFTVTWTKSGTTTAATTTTGSWFDQLSFAGSAPIARTYTRKSTAYFGKYGLNIKL